MVISGHETELFAFANMAVLRKKRVDGSWESASTNENWDLMWCELTGLNAGQDTVELADTDEPHQIQEDDRGEYIEITQEHRSVITGQDQYRTRFRPFWDDTTSDPPWKADGIPEFAEAPEGACPFCGGGHIGNYCPKKEDTDPNDV